MIKYRVFQDGKRCASYKIPTWDKDTFDTFKEAERFATHWCYPIGTDLIEEFLRPMELNVPTDTGWTEVPVIMEIREVQE